MVNQGTSTFYTVGDVLEMGKRHLFPFKFMHKKEIQSIKDEKKVDFYPLARRTICPICLRWTKREFEIRKRRWERGGHKKMRGRDITITEDDRERDIIVTGEDSIQEDDKSILMESGSPPILDQLSAGVLLNDRTMKHWVEKETTKNCFMIYARGLSITWAEDDSYWQWVSLKDAPSGEALVEVAELLNVCWLEVHGRFDLSKLLPETTYEVVFVILVRSWGYGWGVPVSFRLTLPDGAKQEHKENLREKPRGSWIEIKAGELSTSEYKEGEMEVSMFEQEGGHWKSGLVLKGVLIRPKN